MFRAYRCFREAKKKKPDIKRSDRLSYLCRASAGGGDNNLILNAHDNGAFKLQCLGCLSGCFYFDSTVRTRHICLLFYKKKIFGQ